MIDHPFAFLIAPTRPSTFLARIWERRPMVITRGEQGYFDSLLTSESLDRLLATTQLTAAECVLVKNGNEIPRKRYCRGAAAAHVDYRAMTCEFRRGATIIVDGLHRRWLPLKNFCGALQRQLTHPCQANAYVTPAGETGLEPHYDTHDVFVLQIAGRKRWRVHPRAVAFPLKSMKFNREMLPRTKPLFECVLNPGDTLYIPRGFVHQAQAHRSGASTHITLGVLAHTWADLLRASIDHASLLDSAFRKALPSQREADLARVARLLLNKLTRPSTLDRALRHLRTHADNTKKP